MPTQSSQDMKPSGPEEERPTRKTKSDNRFYNFLTRSRSRSQSKNEQASADNPTALQSHVHTSRSSNTHHLHNKLPATPPRPTNGSKPVSRIPSRPLSSTTTATNTTITPGTPKAKKRPPSAVPVPTPPVPEKIHENVLPSSRPTTPKPSATKKKLQNLFGIPLALASRKSSRSRPNSPQPSLDVPPLPTAAFDDDPTPKPRKSFSPHPKSRPQSPTPAPKSKPSDSHPNAASTSNSLKLPKFFSGRLATIPDSSTLQRRPSNTSSAVTSEHSALPQVSGPLRRPSSSYRRSFKPEANVDSVPSQSVASTFSAPRKTDVVPVLPPKITHTPATPLKTQSATDPKVPVPKKGRLSAHHVAKNSSMDSGYRYRGATMGIVDEEGRHSLEITRTASLKGKAKEPDGHLRTGLKKMSTSARNTKHGSFDFERPGWGASVMQRTGSSGTSGTGTSNLSRNGDGIQIERDSVFGPGLAGVGTLQRDVSLKRAKDTEEQLRARDRARRLHEYIQKDKLPPPPAKTPTQGSSPAHSDNHPSTSTNGTGHTGKSSSMSRATGKRSIGGNRAGGSGIGVSRLVGLSAQHGPFSFEPPVPSPTRSTGSTGTIHDPQSWGGKAEIEVEQSKEEKLRQRDRGEKRALVKGDRPPVPVPTPSTLGHRSGAKGRSLDLRLGLSWAPTKMKEAALLPSSSLFARSTSNSSSLGRSTSGSTMARSASSSTNGNDSSRSRRIHIQDPEPEVERSKLGREIAEVFRNILDEDGYTAFKTFVHQFDEHEIPFDGPMGIVERVERLLSSAPDLSTHDKRLLLDKFVRIILQNA